MGRRSAIGGRAFLLLLGFLAIFYSPFIATASESAQGTSPQEPSRQEPQSSRQITIPQISTPPAIDGKIGEEEWKEALVIEKFLSVQTTSAPHEKTRAFLMADQEHLFVAFLCEESQMAALQATQTIRDGTFEFDDHVSIYLDTYHDGQGYYRFSTNPLGTQQDESTRDDQYNAIWSAAVYRGEKLWSVELALPFSILKKPDQEKQEWGINLLRKHKRTEEESVAFYAGTNSTNPRYFPPVSLSIPGGQARLRPEFLPYAIGRHTPSLRSGFSGGIDLKYPFSSTLTLNATLNPDFSNVEVDEATVVPQLAERFLGEFRPFFRDGASFFETTGGPGYQLFYSRRIEQFDWGGKVTGKIGEWTAGLLHARSPDETHSVLSVRKDFGEDLRIGAMAVRREDPLNEQLAMRAHLTYFLNKATSLILNAAKTDDPLPSNDSWSGRLFYKGNWSWGTAVFSSVGANFNPLDGFAAFKDYRGYGVGGGIFREFPKGTWIEYDAGTFLSRDAHLDGSPFRQTWDLWFDGTLRSRWAFDLSLSQGFFEGFNQDSRTLGLGYNATRWASSRISYSTGRFLDSSLQTLHAGANIWPWKRLKISYSLEGIHQKFDSGDITNSSIQRLNFLYEFSPADTLSLQYKFNERGEVNLSAVFRKRLKVDSDLYLVLGEPNSTRTSERIIAKLTWLFR